MHRASSPAVVVGWGCIFPPVMFSPLELFDGVNYLRRKSVPPWEWLFTVLNASRRSSAQARGAGLSICPNMLNRVIKPHVMGERECEPALPIPQPAS